MWLGGALVFGALWALEFGLLFQLLLVAALSVWWTIDDMDFQRSDNRQMYERLGVDPPRASGITHGIYLGALYTFEFMIAAGTVGAACFLGSLIVASFA